MLIEEVLSAGIPALLIDPKGDLTNLCLTFPSLSAAEFRPWIDEAQAKAAGVTPDEFAAAAGDDVARRPAGWGYGVEQITALRGGVRLTIYTPGSQSGVPINIVGSLQAPATRRRRGDRRRDRRLRLGAARPRRHRRRPAVEP